MVRFKKGDKISQLRQVIIIILVFLAGVFGSNLFNSSDLPVSEGFENRLHLVTEVIDGDTIVVNGSNPGSFYRHRRS